MLLESVLIGFEEENEKIWGSDRFARIADWTIGGRVVLWEMYTPIFDEEEECVL